MLWLRMLAVKHFWKPGCNGSQLLHDARGSAAPAGFGTAECPVPDWRFISLVASWMTCRTCSDAASFNTVLVVKAHIRQSHSLFTEQKFTTGKIAFTDTHLRACACRLLRAVEAVLQVLPSSNAQCCCSCVTAVEGLRPQGNLSKLYIREKHYGKVTVCLGYACCATQAQHSSFPWCGCSVGKGVSSLSPENQRGFLECILSNPCHLLISCAESGVIDWWSWQRLIILEALLDSTVLCFWKSGRFGAPKVGNKIHWMYLHFVKL